MPSACAEAAGTIRKPEITVLDRYAMVVNDSAASARVRDAFEQYFTKSRVVEGQPSSASEDFRLLRFRGTHAR